MYGAAIDAEPHNHHALQIVWPQGDLQCHIDDNDVTSPLIINSNISHQLQLSQGWVLLIEPQSDFGQIVTKLLNDKPYITYSAPQASKQLCENADLKQWLTPLLNVLNIMPNVLLENTSKNIDKRIQQLLLQLDECFAGTCIKPEHWRAIDVAAQLSLSESRFLHLFRQEMAIAWRPYLLWRRMMCAIQAMMSQSSATDAAHIAGFSDSAHLSRTFRKNFGMTIRQASSIFKV